MTLAFSFRLRRTLRGRYLGQQWLPIDMADIEPKRPDGERLGEVEHEGADVDRRAEQMLQLVGHAQFAEHPVTEIADAHVAVVLRMVGHQAGHHPRQRPEKTG